jgi:hypothetical protein
MEMRRSRWTASVSEASTSVLSARRNPEDIMFPKKSLADTHGKA